MWFSRTAFNNNNNNFFCPLDDPEVDTQEKKSNLEHRSLR